MSRFSMLLMHSIQPNLDFAQLTFNVWFLY